MSTLDTRRALITNTVNAYEYLIGEATLRHAHARTPAEHSRRYWALTRLQTRYRKTINRLLLKGQ